MFDRLERLMKGRYFPHLMAFMFAVVTILVTLNPVLSIIMGEP